MMKQNYYLFADIFEYPEGDYLAGVKCLQEDLNAHFPGASELLQPFTEILSAIDLIDQQELFIRSFDVQAVTTLDIGYVMFGDDYKRGELLVNLNREHRQANNDCGTELSDYLANILRLLPKMEDHELKTELVQKIVLPALHKMIHSFEPENVSMKDKFYEGKYKTVIDRPIIDYTIYRRALRALYDVLEREFGKGITPQNKPSRDFLANIISEVKLED